MSERSTNLFLVCVLVNLISRNVCHKIQFKVYEKLNFATKYLRALKLFLIFTIWLQLRCTTIAWSSHLTLEALCFVYFYCYILQWYSNMHFSTVGMPRAFTEHKFSELENWKYKEKVFGVKNISTYFLYWVYVGKKINRKWSCVWPFNRTKQQNYQIHKCSVWSGKHGGDSSIKEVWVQSWV